MKVLLRLAVAFAVIAAVFLIMEMSADECDALDNQPHWIVFDPDEVTVYYMGSQINSITTIEAGPSVKVFPKKGYCNPTLNGELYTAGNEGVPITPEMRDTGILIETEKEHYSVNYDSNGGSGVISSLSVVIGETYDISSITFLKQWYHATEWNTNQDGSGESFSSGSLTFDSQLIESLFATENFVTLYPMWLENQYSFSFNNNGGIGQNPESTPDFDITTPLVVIPEVNVTKVGHLSYVWNTSPDGDGIDVIPGNKAITSSFLSEYFETDDRVTLYPKWILSNYSFVFHSGEGVTGTLPDNINNVRMGDEFVIPLPVFTKIGYGWVRWNTPYNSSLTFINDNYVLNEETIGVIPLGEQTIDLYPVWEPTVYRITLTTDRSSVNSSGWTENNGGFVREYTIESDDISLPALVPDDRFHDFICWEDSGEKTVSVVSAGSYGDRTYKAVWNEREYTMNINVNGRIVSQRFTIGSSLESPEPEEGFVFKGWFYKDENGDEKQFSEMSQMTENMSIYAVFEPIKDDPVIIISAVAALISVFAAAMYLSFFRK